MQLPAAPIRSKHRPVARCSPRHGFSFLEVLFSVILLGIGFIMIAGVFPATISQSAATSNETQGAAVCRGALDQIRSVASIPISSNSNVQIFPPTTNGDIQPFLPTQLNALAHGTSFTADPRYGWIGFYSRDKGSPFAQFTIVALFNQDFPNYNGQLPSYPTGNLASNYAPVFIVKSDPTDNSKIIVNPGLGPSGGYNPVAGAFVIIQAALPPGTYSPLNGRVFRLGNDLGADPAGSGGEVFYLQPGFDLVSGHFIPAGATAYIIGRAPTLSVTAGVTTVGPPYLGPNQDIAVMTEYLPVNDTQN